MKLASDTSAIAVRDARIQELEASNQQLAGELAALRTELEELKRSQPPDPASLLNLLRRQVPRGKASLKEIETLLEILGNLGD